MGVMREFRLELTPQQIFKVLKYSKESPKLQAEVLWGVDIVNTLCKPKAVYELFSISFSGQGKVKLHDSKGKRTVDLDFSQRIDLLTPAKLVQVSVITLGTELDMMFKEIQRMKQILKAYILDLITIIALDQAGRSVNKVAEREAALRGLAGYYPQMHRQAGRRPGVNSVLASMLYSRNRWPCPGRAL